MHFVLHGVYSFQHKDYTGSLSASAQDGRVVFEGKEYEEIIFEGIGHFTLQEVTIGIHFHWERQESQTFAGGLKLIATEGEVQAVNLIDTEEYLQSVISSEMRSTSHIELLKAHAVISRSWLLHPILTPHRKSAKECTETEERIVRWYERDAHSRFDICADDHCQRYQGIGYQTSEQVKQAIDETRGMVLLHDGDGEICDARFHKCCGGVTEAFGSCWADEEYPYLTAVPDNETHQAPDLTNEAEAQRWIRTAPEAFCHTQDTRILSQILNTYDRETTDFYRWQVAYSQEELSAIVHERSGIDFGLITDLVPLRRGPSGRIVELLIVGTKRSVRVGKELEIRRWLSRSHLYSSAFVTDKTPQGFLLTGAGWGHGVGLCQIGAAMMAEKGYSWQDILAHYFSHTHIGIV